MAWASEWGDFPRETLDASSFLFDKLDEILAKRLERLEEEETKTDFYTAEPIQRLVFNNGQKKALRDLRRLLQK